MEKRVNYTGVIANCVMLDNVIEMNTALNLQELPGVQLSAGSITSFVKICHQQLAEVEKELKTALVRIPVINQDETGLRVGTLGWWVHVCSPARLTHYAAHPNRGRVGMDAIGIAPLFGGTSVHDGLKSYQGYPFTQALCNVHHVRELTFVEEELKQVWAGKMKALLLEMKAEVEHAKALGLLDLDLLLLARLLRRYDELLTEGYLANPLQKHRRSQHIRSEHQGGPSKVPLVICWIASLRKSGRCSASF